MGELKNYKVGGMDLGDGKPAPADTVLRLDHETAVKMGLVKDDAEPKAKPAREPRTAKRPAPKAEPVAPKTRSRAATTPRERAATARSKK